MDGKTLAVAPGENPVRESVKRALQWEPAIDAWTHIDRTLADRSPRDSGPLAGLPFAVKDVVDVAGMPTRAGSLTRKNASAALQDAEIVDRLRRAGAVPVGKTRTTEFAFVDPTSTRNPHDLEHTPGGSSSGSGAVVGAGIVPVAIGTQTAGSLCRPAVYCGAASYKPSFGRIPTAGMVPLSQSFDTVGVITSNCRMASRVAVAIDPDLAGEYSAARPLAALSIGVFASHAQNATEAEQNGALAAAARALASRGSKVSEFRDPGEPSDVILNHRTVMLYEAARNHGHLLQGAAGELQPKFRSAIEEGAEIDDRTMRTALDALAGARARFWSEAEGFDILVANPVPGPAPRGFAGTGDQSYLTPWTVYYGPLVTIPWGRSQNGLPLGIMLAARPGHDAQLLAAASELERVATALSLPKLPAN